MSFKKVFLLFLCSTLLHIDYVTAQSKYLLDAGWKFSLGDSEGFRLTSFDDRQWRTVELPHDWSIEGVPEETNPAGNDGGYYPTGTAWYRKTLKMPKSYQGKKVYLYFEGVYMNSTVFVNGKQVGGQAYGYTPFLCDITSSMIPGGNNIVAVRVDNSQQKNCRWYSGSGIYRHVWLMVKEPIHFKHWGIRLTTSDVTTTSAKIQVETTVVNTTDMPQEVDVALAIGSEDHGRQTVKLAPGEEKVCKQEVALVNPRLWNVDNPQLYTANLQLQKGGKTIDRQAQKFGVRDIQISTKGLFLNGKKVLLNGGCVHHDNGILGAAAYDRAEVRKVELMKAAGFNAVRTSHNLSSEAFLDACDSLGLLVIDEAFDGWREKKNDHDYSVLFDNNWKHDLSTMVLRDRNHPSIFCWSIGNEVIERKKIEIVTTARKMAALVHQYDSRPVTSALAAWDKDWEIYDPLAAQLDITGYNYLIHYAESDHERVPDRVMMQTESYPREAFKNWQAAAKHDYILGDFVWTSIDYLGESGIGRYWYDGEVPGEHYQRPLFPNHAAYCGDIDLTGWRKPISHYRSLLYGGAEKLYMAVKEPNAYYGKINIGQWAVHPTWESWNWPGHEGKPIEVEVYSHYPKVRLFLDDKLIGEQAVDEATAYKAVFTLPYTAGTLRAEGLLGGEVKESRLLSTASEPIGIRLTADRQMLKADGEDLSFVTIEVVDAEGRLCPLAENELIVKVSGAGQLIALGNANIKDTDSYVDGQHQAWKGRALAVVKAGRKKGAVRLTVSAPGLKPITTKLLTK